MSSVDDSQSSGRSSHSSGYIPDNEEEKEVIEEQIEEVERCVLLSYIYPDLSIEASEIEKIRKNDLKKLFDNKKLILVLNLDYTLINSVLLEDLADTEKHLLDVVDRRPDNLFQLDKHRMLVKLRPYIHEFLKEANNMFEMYLSTTRQEDFAKEVAALLDPENVYFPSRVICGRGHTTRIKNELDDELGVENFVIILDDTENVWEDHKENLIVLEKYSYFAYTVKELGPSVKSLSERGKDESKSGTLKSILDVLQIVHQCFYDPTIKHDATSRDVRVILDEYKKAIH